MPVTTLKHLPVASKFNRVIVRSMPILQVCIMEQKNLSSMYINEGWRQRVRGGGKRDGGRA